MKKIQIYPVVLLMSAIMLLISCNRVVIKVESVPENTPAGQPIFITGNFNNWDPGDDRYQLTLSDDSNYYVTLPPGLGQMEYKFTRGDWTTVEKGICGEETANHVLITHNTDTANHSILSWNDLDPIDCPRLTLVIDGLPSNTPEEDVVAIASNLNSWDPDDASITTKNDEGQRIITLKRPAGINKLEYKLTRGDLSKSEADKFGNEIPNRVLTFGIEDTIKISVEGWTDLPTSPARRCVLLIDKLPENTPENASVYLASDLNSWLSGDKNYQFQRNKNGQFFYSFPNKGMTIDYKITRGGWKTVEVDKNGYDIGNRQLDLRNSDTVYIEIARWKDLGRSGDEEVTIVLEKIPESTPENAKIYLAGPFNDWNPGKLRHVFQTADNGLYYINLPRGNGDLEFRITRGSWENNELDEFGFDMPAHKINYNDFDTLFLAVKNWKDQPEKKGNNWQTLVIDKLPINTPEDENIYLAPDFNGWDPGDDELVFDYLPDGRPYITFRSQNQLVNFKITRGNWGNVEGDKYKNEIQNRVLYTGFTDTVLINIDSWRDR